MLSGKLVVHDDSWQRSYADEAALLKADQKDNFIEIHHIGSTSIIDVYAKPQIDIALIVKDLEKSKSLENIGYEFKGCLNIPFRYFFGKKTEGLHVNLHVMESGNPELEGFLAFRDYMNSHPEARKEYSDLKLKLKKLLESPKNQHLLNEYTLGKNDFITSILKKAGFKGYCMRLVSHYLEKDYEKEKFPIFKPSDIKIVFYKGSEIIGYANADGVTKHVSFFEVSENEDYFRNRFERYLETLK